MALPDPGTVTFENVNAANSTQTSALGDYEVAYGNYTQAAIALQEAQQNFDAATQAAQQALDAYGVALGAYKTEAEGVGAEPPANPAPTGLKPLSGLRK